MAYKYKLVVSKSQKQLLLNHIFAHNQAWNILLSNFFKESETNQSRKENGLEPIYLSDSDKDKLIKSILKNRNINYNVQVIQQTRIVFMKNLIYTLSEIKKGNTEIGMLKFKDSKNFNKQGFKTTKNQYSIIDSKNPKYKILRLFRENFKIIWTRDLPENCKLTNVTFSFKDNQFYVSFNVSYESNTMVDNKNIDTSYLKPLGMDINIDSIDLGNNLFHKSINIKDIKTMNLISKNEKKIKRLKRKQSRRVEGCKKTKTKLGKIFFRTQNK